jgi:hypothetical protein
MVNGKARIERKLLQRMLVSSFLHVSGNESYDVLRHWKYLELTRQHAGALPRNNKAESHFQIPNIILIFALILSG